MSLDSQFEREMNSIDQREADGDLTREEAREERRLLERDYAAAIDELCDEAVADIRGSRW